MSGAYPPPPAFYHPPASRPPSAGTAETLVLVALILQLIGAAVLYIALTFLFGVAAFHPFPFAWLAVSAAVIVGVVGFLFLYCAYEFSYARIRRGEYQAAQAPTLVIGILSLFLGIIPGILYIIGYVKLGDAVREQQTASMPYSPGYGFPTPQAPMAPQVACRGCGRVQFAGQFAFCPHCGQKLGP